MTSPKRPRVLITALVLLPLAALMFGTTATTLASADTGLPTLGLLTALLAIRYNWARWTTLVLLLLLTVMWLPGALEYITDGTMTQQTAATYVLLATALFAAGAPLAVHSRSTTYYEQAATWRRDRRTVPR